MISKRKKKDSMDLAIGDDNKRLQKLSLDELLHLFGPDTGEGGKLPTIPNEEEIFDVPEVPEEPEVMVPEF
jgi:hypothetical protein